MNTQFEPGTTVQTPDGEGVVVAATQRNTYCVDYPNGNRRMVAFEETAPKETPRNRFCDICDAEGYGTKETMVANGWLIGNGMEICWRHD